MMGKKSVGIGCLFLLLLLPFGASAQETQAPKSKVQGSESKVQSLDSRRGKTWKTVAELSAEEKAGLDLRTDTPRDAQFPYLPAEKFPFTVPYTAEEMGLRSAEFPHSPYWNCTLIDIAATVTNTGFL